MPYYVTCPDCGAHNDPGERCDCHTRYTIRLRDREYVELLRGAKDIVLLKQLDAVAVLCPFVVARLRREAREWHKPQYFKNINEALRCFGQRTT